ncbi:MAG: hypothetical protein HKN29_11815 [Rhodothermales bacterium]|nr:hypothetical protein [Rhodothermales bacterium]
MTVYATNPQLAGTSFGAVEVDDVSPRVLSNNRAWVDPAIATTTPGAGFHYGTTDSKFDDVMAFYHYTNFRYYLAGFNTFNYWTGPKIKIKTGSSGTGVNGAATQMDFGMDALTGNSHAHEAAIIAHEAMHIVQMHFTGDGTWVNSNLLFSEKRALSESIADFMAVKYRIDKQGASSSKTALGMHASFGGTPGSSNYLLRDVDNTVQYSAPIVDEDDNSAANQYDVGLAYSGSLWDFQESAFGAMWLL